MMDINQLLALATWVRDVEAARAEALADFRSRTEGKYPADKIAAAEKELVARLNAHSRESAARIARGLSEPQAPSLGLH